MSRAMPMMLMATTQQLRKAGDDPLYRAVIEQAIELILTRFLREDERAAFEIIDADGGRLESPDGRCLNSGHAIESSWFIMEEGRHKGGMALVEQSCRILEWMLDWGWDRKHGVFCILLMLRKSRAFNMKVVCVKFCKNVFGFSVCLIIVLRLLWRPHNEALYACLPALRLTGRGVMKNGMKRFIAGPAPIFLSALAATGSNVCVGTARRQAWQMAMIGQVRSIFSACSSTRGVCWRKCSNHYVCRKAAHGNGRLRIGERFNHA